MLGKFRYMGKPDKNHTAPVKCIIHMFVMHVTEELDVWPEMAQRQRFWVSFQVQQEIHILHTDMEYHRMLSPCML